MNQRAGEQEDHSSRAGADPIDRAADDELRSFGYLPELDRTMGAFSSFAVSFSLISITTGIFANFGYGIQSAGGWVLWAWTVAAIGQTLVALVLADLSTRYPISGYGYQWTSRLVNPHFGFFVGWMLFTQFLSGFPGIVATLADYVHKYAWATDASRAAAPISATALTVLFISAMAMVHLFGIRLVALVNDAGVVTEIAGSALITIALLAVAMAFGGDLSHVADRTNAAGAPAGFFGLCQSLLVGCWCLTGFEAAADLAEETHHPRRTIPRAVILSVTSSAVGGFLMIFAFLVSIDDLAAAQASERPLLDLFETRFGSWLVPFVMLVVYVSIFACGMASMAAATRLVFALARDNMLPGSAWLKRVHPVHQTPRNAILAVWILAAAVVVALENLQLITSVATVTGYLGYLGIVIGSFWSVGLPMQVAGFSLGRLRGPIATLASAWTVFVVVALMGSAGDPRWLAGATLLAVVTGVALYFSEIRERILRGAAGPPAQPIPATGETVP